MTSAHAAQRWVLPQENRLATRQLAAEVGVSPVIAQLLCNRGVNTLDSAKRFLSPGENSLSDPFGLTDMDAAVKRIKQARDSGERVHVFGDYDVDGVSATAILTRALKRFGLNNPSFGLPDRLTDGYGLSADHIKNLDAQDVRLVVTVDNGITAHDAAQAASACGIDLIITDHHALPDALPPASAIINPKRDDPSEQFADLCGAGVAFKLACALNGDCEDIDLAAIATVADVVPLLNENRDLVYAGLAKIAARPSPGISALTDIARANTDDMRAETIAFQLAPRLNAAGRMGSAETALRLLLAESLGEAGALAGELDTANGKRREIQDNIFVEAREQFLQNKKNGQRTIVLARQGWHPGVVGIVAAKLQNQFHMPVVLISLDDDGIGRASARSTPGFDILGGLKAGKDLLERYGGHRAAAGLTIRADNINPFAERFEAHALATIEEDDCVKDLKLDALVSLSQIDGDLMAALDSLEPFGQANPSPVFCSYGIEIPPESIRELRGGHARFTARDEQRGFTAIGFNMAERLQATDVHGPANIAFTPKFNTWRNETTIQLELKDVQFD